MNLQQEVSKTPDVDINGHGQPSFDYTPSNFVTKYPPRFMMALSIAQILCALLSIGFGITATTFVLDGNNDHKYGPAIWCGVMYCLAGSFGIQAAKTKRKGYVITYMSLSIVCALLSAVPFITYIIYLTKYTYEHEWKFVGTPQPSAGYYYYQFHREYKMYTIYHPERYGVYGALVAISLIEAIVAIISVVMCFRSQLCPNRRCCVNANGRQQEATLALVSVVLCCCGICEDCCCSYNGKQRQTAYQMYAYQPLSTQPMSTQPMSTQPMSTQPMSTQPMSTQPISTQPMPVPPTEEMGTGTASVAAIRAIVGNHQGVPVQLVPTYMARALNGQPTEPLDPSSTTQLATPTAQLESPAGGMEDQQQTDLEPSNGYSTDMKKHLVD